MEKGVSVPRINASTVMPSLKSRIQVKGSKVKQRADESFGKGPYSNNTEVLQVFHVKDGPCPSGKGANCNYGFKYYNNTILE